METIIKNVGSYVVIERIDNSKNFGDDVYYGIVKYHSQKSNIERIYKNGVTYLKKNIEGKINIDNKEYDLVLYYNIILNFIYPDEFKSPTPSFSGIKCV